MKIIEHTIDIEATAETTWAVLHDFAAYSDWNPFMTVDGTIAATGDRPIITIRPGTRTMTFRPTITNIEAGRSIAWLGHLLVPGVFDGAHELHVHDLGNGRSRFTQRETFRGALVPFMPKVLRDTDSGFVAMNAALAERAASRQATDI